MFFQILDNKKQCRKVFHNGILTNDVPKGLSVTWEEHQGIDLSNTLYMKHYCQGKSLEEVCPENLKEAFLIQQNKMKAYIKALQTAKVDLKNNCYYELIPTYALKDFCSIKNQITKHVYETVKQPNNYQFLVDLSNFIKEISNRELNLDLNSISRIRDIKSRQLIKLIKKSSNKISYNMYKSKTGRLTTNPGSFPFLNLKKELRKVLRPTNDHFIELDYNANELRVLLSLSGKEQPTTDIHIWNQNNIFPETMTREEAKKAIFKWLYKDDYDSNIESFYSKGDVRQQYYDKSTRIVENPFGRVMEDVDDFHALNYILQSTASDSFLTQALKVRELLKGRKSFITGLNHDSLIIDISKDDKALFPKALKIFKETNLGTFVVNASVGLHYGDMRRI